MLPLDLGVAPIREQRRRLSKKMRRRAPPMSPARSIRVGVLAARSPPAPRRRRRRARPRRRRRAARAPAFAAVPRRATTPTAAATRLVARASELGDFAVECACRSRTAPRGQAVEGLPGRRNAPPLSERSSRSRGSADAPSSCPRARARASRRATRCTRRRPARPAACKIRAERSSSRSWRRLDGASFDATAARLCASLRARTAARAATSAWARRPDLAAGARRVE